MEQMEQQKIAWRDHVTLGLLALTVLFYPFNLFPYGPFLKLTLYPLLGLFCLNFDRIIGLTLSRPLFRYLALAGGAWLLWTVISLCLAVGPSAIEVRHVHEVLNDVKRFVPWYTFVACCFLVPRVALKRVLYGAIVGLFALCSVYATLEALHFTGVAWATATLKVVIHGFMRTELCAWTNGNFWPPVLWDSERYRSFFEEPAYFAVFAGFCVLFFTAVAWRARRRSSFVGHFVLAAGAVVLLCKTESAAGAIALAVASGTWMLLAGCFWSRASLRARWRMGAIALFLVGASLVALMTQRHPAEHLALMTQAHGKVAVQAPVATATRVSQSEANSTVPTTSTPVAAKPAPTSPAVQEAYPLWMSTRAIHLSTELKCIAASPIYGYGVGEYARVMHAALQAAPKKTDEIKVWALPENRPPKLNLFTGFAVTYGCVGLLLFLAWFALPTMVLWLKQWRVMGVEQGCVVAALGVFLLCPMMSASMEVFCYMLLATVPLILVTEGADEGKRDGRDGFDA